MKMALWCERDAHTLVVARRRDSLGRTLYGIFCTQCRHNLTDHPTPALAPFGGHWHGQWLPRWRVVQLGLDPETVPWFDALDPPRPNAQTELL